VIRIAPLRKAFLLAAKPPILAGGSGSFLGKYSVGEN